MLFSYFPRLVFCMGMLEGLMLMFTVYDGEYWEINVNRRNNDLDTRGVLKDINSLLTSPSFFSR